MPVSDNAVAYEMQQWEDLPRGVVDAVRDDLGLLDEFPLISEVKGQFSTHSMVVQRTASHLPHEADCETFFALSKSISDPNMFPSMLRALSKVAANIKVLKPGWEEILERYYAKYGRQAPEVADNDE